jgi:protein-disulfide isomerase
VSRASALKLAMVALLAFALFAVAQALVAPKTFEVKAIPSAVTNAPAPGIALAQTSAPPVTPANTPPPNWLGLYGGAFKMNLNEVPMWGSPDAPRKLVSLYDYSCHVCAEMHSRIAAVAREIGPKLAVVSLPMPLDSKCNPMIRRTPPAHTNACAYARLGLAVWRTKPSAIEAYDDWFFDVFVKSEARIPNGQPPSYEEAKTHALQLVGDPVKFEQALHDPWIDQQIAASVALFGIGWKQYHNDRMPQFIIGTNLVSGIVDAAQLKAIAAKYVSAP